MEKCRVCGRIVSGSQWDSYKNELGQVLPEKAWCVCSVCEHLTGEKLKDKGERDGKSEIYGR